MRCGAVAGVCRVLDGVDVNEGGAAPEVTSSNTVEIFLSYRRTDNEWLAGSVADRLAAALGDSVFFDQTEIFAGSNFRAVIDERISKCGAVVALIGPQWDVGRRLHDPNDFVCYELSSAMKQGKRVIPVLHSDRSMPSVGDLPDALGWLPLVQSVQLGSRGQLGEGIDRIVAVLRSSVPPLKEQTEQAWQLYGRRDDDAALQLIEQVWRDHGAQPSAGLADCCRAAAIILTRQGDRPERFLWLARAFSVGIASGARNVVALSMLPYFFQLSAASLHEDARSVLDEMYRLIDDDSLQTPRGDVVRRSYHENRAWSLAESGRVAEAVVEYQLAFETAGSDDTRGARKAKGGQANCLAALGDVAAAIQQTVELIDAAEADGWIDVAEIGRTNLDRLRSGHRPLLAYEVT